MSIPRDQDIRIGIYPGGYYWINIPVDTWILRAHYEDELVEERPTLVQDLDPMWWRIKYSLTHLKEKTVSNIWTGWKLYVDKREETSTVGPAGKD